MMKTFSRKTSFSVVKTSHKRLEYHLDDFDFLTSVNWGFDQLQSFDLPFSLYLYFDICWIFVCIYVISLQYKNIDTLLCVREYL